MKRVFLHVGFWSLYILFCMATEYMWAVGAAPDLSTGALLKGMIIVAIGTSIPEILFSYFMMYYGFDRLIKKKGSQVINLLIITLVFVACVILVRLATYYILGHVVYNGRMSQERIFDPLIISRSIIFMGFAAGVSVSIKMLRNQLVAKEREKNLVREKLNTELQLLRNQLHPHFLFNTLNNIYALTRKKSDLAPEAVLKLSELLSFMLYESRKETIPVSTELAFLEDYISLERIRYDKRLDISFEKEIEDPDQPIAALLLLPLVENAFKHGAGENRYDSFIRISLKQEQGDFSFSIENSFETPQTAGDENRIGLNNIRRQLELLYHEYNLDVNCRENVFGVTLYLNLHSYGKN
jgi:two-component system, LytTR family, sensor kinase